MAVTVQPGLSARHAELEKQFPYWETLVHRIAASLIFQTTPGATGGLRSSGHNVRMVLPGLSMRDTFGHPESCSGTFTCPRVYN